MTDCWHVDLCIQCQTGGASRETENAFHVKKNYEKW